MIIFLSYTPKLSFRLGLNEVPYDFISGVIAGLQKVYPHFSVMPDGPVHKSQEKLRAHFCTRGPPQRLD